MILQTFIYFFKLQKTINCNRIFILVQTSCPLEKFEFESETELDEKCAICWEAAAVARKLPCGHYFHHGTINYFLLNHIGFT